MLFLPLLRLFVCLAILLVPQTVTSDDALSGTERLTINGDLTDRLVAGVDRFLLRKLSHSADQRGRHWHQDRSSPEAYTQSIQPNRKQLAHILGMRQQRPATIHFSPQQMVSKSASRQERIAGKVRVRSVKWLAFDTVHGEGLLLEPIGSVNANLVWIPDASETPESLVSHHSGPIRLASSGCRVVIPALVPRQVHQRRNAELTDREYVYRSAFELGHHLIGYELQKVLAAVDWFSQTDPQAKTGVIGWGDGGMFALYAGAVDPRIDVTVVSGYFGKRWNHIWNGPIDRNVFGLLDQFGDAELASMIAPRALVLDRAEGPRQENRTRSGAPYTLTSPTVDEFAKEASRCERLVGEVAGTRWRPELAGSRTSRLAPDVLTKLSDELGLRLFTEDLPALSIATDESRGSRMIREMDRFTQRMLALSPYVRKEFLSRLDLSSPESHAGTVEPYREFFRKEVIGIFDDPLLPLNPRTRKVFDKPKWTGYEVVLDVYPDVIAYGIVLLPKGMQPDEKRPVVVCQHGLEGRPRDIIQGDHAAYHDFAAKLAERGFITFAPQNLYIFRDAFRTLQRKANPLGKTLFSVIVPQHQQIVNWLGGLPNVDPDRIAFYGLSYGGKSAMRIPPLVKQYCLSICSADFNDWVWKNASTLSPYSYVWTGEYEIFEWDLGSTFNYSEMAALIAPRPFMVERGHFDGVAPDERVALEFAKVRHLYQARLGIGDRCEIEWFAGPHTIHGKGTFDFLHRHLRWPKPAE